MATATALRSHRCFTCQQPTGELYDDNADNAQELRDTPHYCAGCQGITEPAPLARWRRELGIEDAPEDIDDDEAPVPGTCPNCGDERVYTNGTRTENVTFYARLDGNAGDFHAVIDDSEGFDVQDETINGEWYCSGCDDRIPVNDYDWG